MKVTIAKVDPLHLLKLMKKTVEEESVKHMVLAEKTRDSLKSIAEHKGFKVESSIKEFD